MSGVEKNDNVALEERIERIRKNNERIQRRYLEVEADKQKAAKSNALVQFKQLPDEEPFQHPYNTKPKQEAKNSENGMFTASPRMQKQGTTRSCYKVAENPGGKCFTFSQSDGPPPDPVYNFLADVERDPKFGNVRGNVFRGSRGGRATLAYYREREANIEAKNRNRRRGYGNDISVKPEYEAWKNERYEIDRQRINRQKTAGGEWRREWDKEKTSESMDGSMPETVERKSFHQYEKNTLRNYVQNFDSDKIGISKKFPTDLSASLNERGNLRVSRANVRGQRVVSYSSISASPVNSGSATVPKSPKPERTVTDLGDSLKVSLPNNESPIQKAKVTSRSTAGSGRVPHQKYRTSYSSQSEDDSSQKPIVRRSGKRSFQSFRGEDNNTGNQTPDKGEKAAILDDDRVVKPPLHPNTERKSDPSKPKKQRGRYMKNDNRNRQKDKLQNVSHSNVSITTKEVDSSSKDDAVSGDDGWEDVATSGTESMSEEILPKEQKEETIIVDNEVGSATHDPSELDKSENDRNEVINVEITSVTKSVNIECEHNVTEAEICSETNNQFSIIDKCEVDKEKANDNVNIMSKENSLTADEHLCSSIQEICPENIDRGVDADKCENNNANGNLEIVCIEKSVNKEENKFNQQEAVISELIINKQVDTNKCGNNKETESKNVELVTIESPVNILKQLTEACTEMDNKPSDKDKCKINGGVITENLEIVDMGKHVNKDESVSNEDIKKDDIEIIKKESSNGANSNENTDGLTSTIDKYQEIRGACKIESCSKIITPEDQTILKAAESLTAVSKAVKSDVDKIED